MSSLYVVDGYSLVYRSYFAMIRNPLFNPKGNNASAIYGFFRTVLSLINDRKPTHFAIALDSRTPTFRHEKYEEYKATREKTPEDLKNEIPVIEEILERLGIPTLRVDGFEADDIMATLATRAHGDGRECWVVSGDKDLLQLVDGPVKVLKPESGGSFSEVDRDAVIEKWGVTPEQILDYLSLVGDSSDNVPGVKGIGAKTAAALLGQFPTLEAIYEGVDEIKSKSQRAKLEDSRENAFLSKDLIRLAVDVPISDDLVDLQLGELNVAEAAPYFAAEGMRSLLRDLTGKETVDLPDDDPLMQRAELVAARGMESWLADKAATLDPSGATDEKASVAQLKSDSGRNAGGTPAAGPGPAAAASQTERPALISYSRDAEDAKPGSYDLVDTTEKLEAWCAKVKRAGIAAFDSETTSIDVMVARPVGFSFSTGRGNGCYIVLHGPDGPVIPEDEAREHLKAVLEDPKMRIIGQNLKYDYKIMARWGVRIANPWFDTMIAAWLLDTESNRLGMDALAQDYLGYETVHYVDVVPKAARGEPENTFDVVPLDQAVGYAAEDADITYRLFRVLEPLLEERGMRKLFRDLEMPLIPILSDMEMRGIRLDTGALAEYSVELEKDLHAIETEIYGLVGHEFNIGSPKQLQVVLFEERGLQPGKKTKTGYSTDSSVLQELAREDRVPELILRHRVLAKLKSTYVDSLPTMVNAETERIHTHFNINGTATGRISSTDPNLQNIPIRDEEGRRIREAFVPEDGWVFVSADYSQVELVVLAHLSDDPGLKHAFAENIDVHRHTGSLVFGIDSSEVSDAQRRIAKTINFGVMYGMSAFRLSRELQIPRRDADSFIEAYFSTYSRIKGFIDETVADAERTGFVQTILGRKRYLANISNRNRTVKMAQERIAVNTPIQGSAADIMKQAMINLAVRLAEGDMESRLLLQVHDELILECPPDEVDAISDLLRSTMAEAITLSIPLKVSIESGASWGVMH